MTPGTLRSKRGGGTLIYCRGVTYLGGVTFTILFRHLRFCSKINKTNIDLGYGYGYGYIYNGTGPRYPNGLLSALRPLRVGFFLRTWRDLLECRGSLRVGWYYVTPPFLTCYYTIQLYAILLSSFLHARTHIACSFSPQLPYRSGVEHPA